MNEPANVDSGSSPSTAGARRSELDMPSRAEAEQAVRTLIRWAGDRPDRQGLQETPARVVRAYQQWFSGYRDDPEELLQRTFEEVAGYDEVVLLRDIRFVSHCEHHMAPIIGRVHIGVFAAASSRRNFQAGSSRRALCPAIADSGANDSGDCQYTRSSLEARRRRCRDRGDARLHEQPWSEPIRFQYGDEPDARRFS